MFTRRTFMKTAAVAGGMIGWEQVARAAEGKPLIVRDAKIIRVRDRKGGATGWTLRGRMDGLR